MPDFWARKKQELQKEGKLPVPRPSVMASDGPWWQDPRETTRQAPKEPQGPSQGRAQAPRPGEYGQVSCPHCRSGNYSKPSPSTASRCFECGYVDGRQLNEPNLPGIAVTDAPSVKTRQLSSQGHFGRSAAEIAENNAVLEQSAQGRAKLG